MAMGRAVVITRNPLFDIDVDQEGIGLVVEPGDVEGWRRALDWLVAHPDEVAEMGARGRRLCEERYNLETFSRVLVETAEELTAPR
jgi:glycosyltransferase involved in cell wall biosynthesis